MTLDEAEARGFSSTLPGQCSPAQHHVLLVPTTDVLLNARDRESHALYADLSGSEEFLASHVLRIPGGIPPGANGKDTSFRESRGKAKQYTTANGRFKSLNQAQLLNDVIYYPDSFDAQPWLVYYISRPLIGVSMSNGSTKMPSTLEIYDEEDMMRRSLETAVTAAIDLFQMVDKQQLSNLGATTDLTGPIVERMIERYICEQAHETILFPRICTIRRFDDLELESRVRQMQDLDISQVGIPIENGQQGKLELAARLAKGVEIFKKMGSAGSPQEMLDVLLATQKLVTMPESAKDVSSQAGGSSHGQSEKQDAMLTINADTLVSLVLVVVIRSSVRHLQARLSYMRHFIFIDDVETGEQGYALSTFEAVLSYLDRTGQSVLMMAVEGGQEKSLKYLLSLDEYYPLEEVLSDCNNEGTTLLIKLLYHCDSDANAANDKAFTPLMVASKYGRTDLVRVLFTDPRVDLYMKDTRGLTAVELAKDDEVRNRIDDLVLLSNPSGADGRTTTVVRSYFVEDGTIRMVLKSGAPNGNNSITVTTCRRSLADFENLAKWLGQENPASWIPTVTGFPTPFLIPSKPSRAILKDIQLRLDSFLSILLHHPTFATHEMVWEFFLVPDIDQDMLAERSKRKAETRVDRVKEEYTPILDVREVELFVQHARESVRGMHHSAKSVLRRTNKVRAAANDLVEAAQLGSMAISTLVYLPESHKMAFERYVKTLTQMESSPLTGFYYNMQAMSQTIQAILTSLSRPGSLIGSMGQTQKAIDRHTLSLRRSDRWPLGLLDDTRHRMQRDAAEKVDKSVQELETLGKELKYTQQTVAAELAAWQETRVKQGRKACRELARRMVVVEKARLESMRRAIRGLGISEGRRRSAVEGLRKPVNGLGSGRETEVLEDL
ncbi:Vps9 domain-containing protein [Neofusicoccum parvum]|nr:Vps9 domain-containing protein [Neofusicoccum parvum]